MDTAELVSGVVDGLSFKTLDLATVLRAVIVVLVGVIVIRMLLKIVDRSLERSKSVSSIRGYIRSVAKVGLWFLLGLIVADCIGLPVTSLIALLSVAGLAVSLALQNTLANLAGGIMLLVSKPFEVGDYVEADGVNGTVNAIGLSYSTLVTPDNKEIFIPNSQIAEAKIINYNRLGKRRVEMTFNAAYDTDTETVRTAIQEVLSQYPQILDEPEPAVWVSKYGSSSIEYVVRAWVASEDYWDVYYGVIEGVRPAFARHGVEMTYDHLNVHMVDR